MDRIRDLAVIPLPDRADSEHEEPADSSSKSGSGARIRTVNLAVNSTGGLPIGTSGDEFARCRWSGLRAAVSTLFGVRAGVHGKPGLPYSSV